MKYADTNFANQDVDLDNNEFISCEFKSCNLIYHGGKPPSLVNCSFSNFRITFSGAASDTLSFMTGLYHGGFKSVIDATFGNIRRNPKEKSWTFH